LPSLQGQTSGWERGGAIPDFDRLDRAPAGDITAVAAAPPPPHLPRGRVLVVEDDAVVRESLVDLLNEEGYQVSCAENGREALRHLHAEPAPDVILLDLRMPVMDGWEFRSIQKSDPKLAHIPVIAISADGSPQAAAISAHAYLRKPVETEQLLAMIARVRWDDEHQKARGRDELQDSARYRGLLEAAPDAMVVVNQRGEIVLLNVQAEKQFGYRRDELVGQKVTNIIPKGFAERLIADGLRSAEEALAQRIGTGIELTGRRKNGSEFPIEIMLSPLGRAEDILVTAAIRDITLRKFADAQLLQYVKDLNRSNEELRQFAYIASHDLQEPLRMVASYTQLLSRRYKGQLDADADQFIAFAVDGASRMQRLIQDLLAYSQIGTKGRQLIDTSSEETLQQALLNLKGAIEDSGAVVTHEVLPAVLADGTQLIQLFQNLVGNAIKYQSAGTPRIHISVAREEVTAAPPPAGAAEGGKWIFSVRDNGLGIDPKYFEKIFGMFQRLHKREEFAGTGIGLAICKKIVERHGGGISVESQPGAGSTFRFALRASGPLS
jgi:PAS domain S-box-containing protein